MKKYLTSLFLGTTLVLAACGGGSGSDDDSSSDDNASDDSNANQGEEIAKRENCASCHGQDYEGGNGPALKGTDLAEDKFKDIVKNGTDSGMPAHEDLSDDDLDELYQFFTANE